jgi:SAM-dependent methyltransferase
MGDQKQIFDMGESTSDIFRGESNSDAIRKIYGQSAEQFADIVKSKLPPVSHSYSLLDIGSSKGELLGDVLRLLPDYHFVVTITDTNPEAVAQNMVVGKKIIADAESLPFQDKEFDLILMRYVLQFNSFDGQKKIIDEIARVVSKIAIVQHAGPDTENPDLWREKVEPIFSDDKLPQIKRSGMFWSSHDEIEKYMTKRGIRFEMISTDKINGFSQTFIERYDMNNKQAQQIRNLLGDKDYLLKTTWIILPEV